MPKAKDRGTKANKKVAQKTLDQKREEKRQKRDAAKKGK